MRRASAERGRRDVYGGLNLDQSGEAGKRINAARRILPCGGKRGLQPVDGMLFSRRNLGGTI